ncbi:putative esterase [Oceanicola granulosus HTCC2516]|uniref:Putative esterase n=1 Tax=Oceanicola granulosus (strain ATCC BAA-861 / DSM 15982 / KCTC 12143 / HTCC2516) TaxID=314256 RepID=Q2CD37_OCEGH|nr:serine hydrolase domain-containing protein [Oceanicola granulosus]EAR50641.1 putative esterase [Oceanicola granulosus HTCC2516]
MVLIRSLLALLLLAGSAAADVARIEAAWQDWARDARVRNSTIAITRDGDLVGTRAIGRRSADAPAPLASLSKSITGACVLALEEAGRLSLDTTIGQALGGAGLPMTDGAAAVTVRELLTHTSGFTLDSTQGRPAPWRARGGDQTLRVAANALLQTPARKGFFYNNENYAVLGAIIQAVSGESAAGLCPRLVLAPLGLRATVSDEFGGGVPWGGYEMTAADFALFAATLRPRRDWPRADMGSGVSYGPGVIFKRGGGNAAWWHFGSWCFLFGRSAGAYFFQYPNGWGVTVTYDRCLSNDQTLALDAALTSAVGRS